MVKQDRNKLIIISLAVLLLGISSFIYLVFRSDNIIGFRLIHNLGLSGLLHSIRDAMSVFSPSAFTVYSLPDGLWLISYMLLTEALLPDHPTKPLWIFALPANAIVSEIAQYCHLLPGNFDIWDLVCYTVPTVLYLIFRKGHSVEGKYSFEEVMGAPLLLVTYLFIAGCSVERLNTPFVITCAVYASILMVINYALSKTKLIINK